jgi:DNA-binding GntR family transcriptional regulator
MLEYHYSPALHGFAADRLHVTPLTGVEADIHCRLWRSILEAKVLPGTWLREQAIGEVFGVSRTIVRGVLRILERETVVQLLPNRGACVVTPTPEDTISVFEALDMVLSYVIERLADPASTVIQAEQRELIELHIQTQTLADAGDDRIKSHLLGSDFLVLLAVFHGIPTITEFLDRMLMRLVLSLMHYRQYPVMLEHAGFQRRLADAILNRNRDQAVDIARERSRVIQRGLRMDDETSKEVDWAAVLGQP